MISISGIRSLQSVSPYRLGAILEQLKRIAQKTGVHRQQGEAEMDACFLLQREDERNWKPLCAETTLPAGALVRERKVSPFFCHMP